MLARCRRKLDKLFKEGSSDSKMQAATALGSLATNWRRKAVILKAGVRAFLLKVALGASSGSRARMTRSRVSPSSVTIRASGDADSADAAAAELLAEGESAKVHVIVICESSFLINFFFSQARESEAKAKKAAKEKAQIVSNGA